MTASDTIQKMICGECNMASTNICPKCDIKKALDLLEKKEQGLLIEVLSNESEQSAKDLIIGQVMWERNVAISQLKEIGKGLGQKMDDVKKLVEAKKNSLLIELPVPLGERVWYILDNIVSYKTMRLYDIECGMELFATREEAEKRLEELRNG